MKDFIPYTYINRIITEEVEHLTLALSRRLESLGIVNVPTPTDDPSEYWEPELSYARGILSLRHAGHLAGLGVFGKNTLLIKNKLGNMIQIGALLLNAEFEADSVATYQCCEEGCNLGVQSCPQSALKASIHHMTYPC